MRFSWRRWFSLTIRAKRWIAFFALGFLMVAFAGILAVFSTLVITPANIATIRSFHPVGLGAAALSALLLGIFWIYKGFLSAAKILWLKDHETSQRLRALMFKSKVAARPSLVALGGGTGLSSLLKGLRELDVDLTAIVTVTDDGGSSGRLRKDLQILPPGDIRNCLVALAKSESLLSRLFQFRFTEAGNISGHSFGNLFIAAMTEVLGDFGSAVREASSILAIRGTVIPVTSENVQLSAHFEDGTNITGESAISAKGGRIANIEIVPTTPEPNPEALSAIDDAQLVVLGPGSLFTSVIPNLLVPQVAERINRCTGEVLYICNVMTQPGETGNFSAVDHVRSILQNTPLTRIDTVIVNSRQAAKPLMHKYEARGQYWVPPTVLKIREMGIQVVSADLLSETDLVRHNPNSLALTMMELMYKSKDDDESED